MSESPGQSRRDPSDSYSGADILRVMAYGIIVIAGLRQAESLLLPVLLAALLALACFPFVRRLESWRVPSLVAVLLVVCGLLVVVVATTAVVGNSILEFTASVDDYGDRLSAHVGSIATWLRQRGVQVSREGLVDAMDASALLGLVAVTMDSVLGLLSNGFVILLITVFLLLEASGFPAKLRFALGNDQSDLSGWSEALDSIHGYLGVKTAVSLLTGGLVTVLLVALDVEFPFLWGLVAFLFNFIPNVGSIFAAVPAVLITLVVQGPANALLVALGYVAINTVIGNFLEPRIMGRRLGLSPAVVILSLVFWSWVWGPVGMLLSLPMTMVVKIALEHSPDLVFVARLLGPANALPAVRPASAPEARARGEEARP